MYAPKFYVCVIQHKLDIPALNKTENLDDIQWFYNEVQEHTFNRSKVRVPVRAANVNKTPRIVQWTVNRDL